MTLDVVALCLTVSAGRDVVGGRCGVGWVRVYFRAGVLEDLEDRRTRAIASRVVRAQALWRAHCCRT